MGGMDSQSNYHSKDCTIPREFRQRQKALIRLRLVSASWDFVRLLNDFFFLKSTFENGLNLVQARRAPWMRRAQRGQRQLEVPAGRDLCLEEPCDSHPAGYALFR